MPLQKRKPLIENRIVSIFIRVGDQVAVLGILKKNFITDSFNSGNSCELKTKELYINQIIHRIKVIGHCSLT